MTNDVTGNVHCFHSTHPHMSMHLNSCDSFKRNEICIQIHRQKTMNTFRMRSLPVSCFYATCKLLFKIAFFSIYFYNYTVFFISAVITQNSAFKTELPYFSHTFSKSMPSGHSIKFCSTLSMPFFSLLFVCLFISFLRGNDLRQQQPENRGKFELGRKRFTIVSHYPCQMLSER